MKNLVTFFLLLLLAVSCRERNSNESMPTPGTVGEPSVMTGDIIEVADNLIYDVIIKVNKPDDPWEVEKIAGYHH